MNTRYIAPKDPPKRPIDAKSRGLLPRNPLAGLPAYVRRKRSKYVPGLSRRDRLALDNVTT